MVIFFEGLRSERQLMRVVADRLSLRWYCGYDLHETLPDHSSLTRIRGRYGLEVFRRYFAKSTTEKTGRERTGVYNCIWTCWRMDDLYPTLGTLGGSATSEKST